MQQERPEVDWDISEERLKRQRREALDILLEARDRLVSQLCSEILSNRDAILEDPGSEGLFGFEFQKIEERYERYITRLQTLNSILENLEYRRPRIAHKVETFSTTPEDLRKDLAAVVDRYDQWDLVDIDVTPIENNQFLVVVGFTADEYVD